MLIPVGIINIVEKVEYLPGIIELLQDKSVLLEGKYFRLLDGICKVKSVDGDNKAAITPDIHISFSESLFV